MFNLQGSEIIIVLLLALVVLGPEKLPDAMRKMGQAYAELKKMSSGFQTEFRSVIEEPMREVKDTAKVLRDSADFTKLQAGERDEKPKSAEMAPADPADVPTDEVPNFETGSDGASAAGPDLAAESKPAPFSDESSAVPQPARSEATTPVSSDTDVVVPAPEVTPAATGDTASGESDADPATNTVTDTGAVTPTDDDTTR